MMSPSLGAFANCGAAQLAKKSWRWAIYLRQLALGWGNLEKPSRLDSALPGGALSYPMREGGARSLTRAEAPSLPSPFTSCSSFDHPHDSKLDEGALRHCPALISNVHFIR